MGNMDNTYDFTNLNNWVPTGYNVFNRSLVYKADDKQKMFKHNGEYYIQKYFDSKKKEKLSKPDSKRIITEQVISSIDNSLIFKKFTKSKY